MLESLLGEWMRPVFQALWNHQQLLNVLRFAVSFLILLIPTTAMGLTLPVLLEDPILKRQEFGHGIGFLYGGNTLGAMAASSTVIRSRLDTRAPGRGSTRSAPEPQ